MLTNEELIYFCFILVVLWLFPILKLIKTNKKLLIINLIGQFSYSFFFLYLLENYGSKGSSLLWLFYWLSALIIHLLVLNFWTLSEVRKRKKRVPTKPLRNAG
jgi:Na+-driven multidrug efflux pump